MRPGRAHEVPRTVALLVAMLCTLRAGAVLGVEIKRRIDPAVELKNVVAIERAFARAAAKQGTRDAFLAYLADDGIVFRPGPVNGKELWRDREPSRSLLSWEPVFADVASAGDLGYTTGPWEWREKGPRDRPTLFGNYFTIWKKQADGSWKVALDGGNTNPRPKSTAALRLAADVGSRRSLVRPSSDPDSERVTLLEAEREFADETLARGPALSYLGHTAEEIRLLREGHQPITGRLAAQRFLISTVDSLTWEPLFTDLSRSADLGYDYGRYRLRTRVRAAPAESGHYVRLWKRQPGRSWKVAVDLLIPQPPPPPPASKG